MLERLVPTERELRELALAETDPARARRFAPIARGPVFAVLALAAVGLAALPGVLAAKTTLPVIGVPLVSGPLAGVDALMSIVQMPPGIPVATVAVGKAGCTNAAFLAAGILGIKYPEIRRSIEKARAEKRDAILGNVDPKQG